MAVDPATIYLIVEGAKTAWNFFANRSAGNAAKDLAEFNAKIAELRAQDALVRGQEAESRFRLGVKALIGSQRTGFAAQNVDVGVGSAVDVQADAAFLGELDALQLRTNARREAWGYKVEAENFRRGGENAQRAGNFAAGGTLLEFGADSLLMTKYFGRNG